MLSVSSCHTLNIAVVTVDHSHDSHESLRSTSSLAWILMQYMLLKAARFLIYESLLLSYLSFPTTYIPLLFVYFNAMGQKVSPCVFHLMKSSLVVPKARL